MESYVLDNINHELKNNISAFAGLLLLLEKSNLNEEQLYYVNMLKSSSDSMLSILNNGLYLAKFEHEQMELFNEEFNLHKLIENMCELYSFQIIDVNINMKCNIIENVPEKVKGDSQRLKQILSNLLSNSIKFTTEGFIKVNADIIEIKNNKINLLFSVEDTGEGIPGKIKPYLFERYYTSDNKNGNGLGLNISKMLVELMGGKISVESNDTGTIFMFDVWLDLI